MMFTYKRPINTWVLLFVFLACLPGCAKAEEDPIVTFRAYFAALVKGDNWGSYLSDRLKNYVTDSIIEGLNTTYKTDPNTSINDLALEKSDAYGAIIAYKVRDVNGKVSPIMRAYLVKENGRWAVDDILSMAPDWALSPEEKKLQAPFQAAADQYVRLFHNEDVAAVKEFAKSNLATDSLAEISPDMFAAKMKASPTIEVIGPVSVSVNHAETEGITEYRNVHYGYICRRSHPKGVTKVKLIHSTLVFVKEDAGWKVLSTDVSDRERVIRFLELWQQGERQTMDAMLTADASVSTKAGVSIAWRGRKGALPRPQPYREVMLDEANALSQDQVPWRLIEGATGGEHDRVITVDMAFPADSGWPSGMYQFHLATLTRYGFSTHRIGKICYVGPAESTVSPKQTGKKPQ